MLRGGHSRDETKSVIHRQSVRQGCDTWSRSRQWSVADRPGDRVTGMVDWPSTELGKTLLQVTDPLGDAPFVLDEGEPDEALAAGTEAHAGRQGDLTIPNHQRAELDRVHLGVGLGDRCPDEHRP